jgi:hypothetical protein
MLIDISDTILVGGGVCEGCFSKSNSLVAGVEDRIESLKESHADNEIHRSSSIRINVSKVGNLNNQMDFTGNTTNFSIKDTRPDLSVRGEFECNLVKKER